MVVVLATPPFWLANAMTLALPFTGGSYSIAEADLGVIRRGMRDSCMFNLRINPCPSAPRGLAKRLKGKRVVVCLGAGGVGKTTTSAALGVRVGRARARRSRS